MNRKGTELSMNIVIVAILGLLILAVLLYFVFGVFNGASDDINCPTKYKGVCREECGTLGTAGPAGSCGDNSLQCCKLIG